MSRLAVYACVVMVVAGCVHADAEPRRIVSKSVSQPSWQTHLDDALHLFDPWFAALRANAAPSPSRRPPRHTTMVPTAHRAHRGYATVEECIAAVENGGDYGRSSNRSHFGKYQFSPSTWAAYGGDPATWGSASPQEQDAVFANAIAAGGEGNWRPYDGC